MKKVLRSSLLIALLCAAPSYATETVKGSDEVSSKQLSETLNKAATEADALAKQWLAKEGVKLEKEVGKTKKALSGLNDKINVALVKTNDEINQWIIENGSALEKKAEETKAELTKLNDMLKSEAETTQAELTKWLKENGEDMLCRLPERRYVNEFRTVRCYSIYHASSWHLECG